MRRFAADVQCGAVLFTPAKGCWSPRSLVVAICLKEIVIGAISASVWLSNCPGRGEGTSENYS